jgi:hypothetical protein
MGNVADIEATVTIVAGKLAEFNRSFTNLIDALVKRKIRVSLALDFYLKLPYHLPKAPSDSDVRIRRWLGQ